MDGCVNVGQGEWEGAGREGTGDQGVKSEQRQEGEGLLSFC